MPSDDTVWALARCWIFVQVLRVALWVAPDDDSKRHLKSKIGEWAAESERQFYLRYPHRRRT